MLYKNSTDNSMGQVAAFINTWLSQLLTSVCITLVQSLQRVYLYIFMNYAIYQSIVLLLLFLILCHA